MSLQRPVSTAQSRPAHPATPQVAYHAAERALLRRVDLRALSVLEEMYAYYGADRT